MSSIPRIYIDKEFICNNNITVQGDNYHHLVNVLRLKVGDDIVVCNKAKMDYMCEVTEIDKNLLHAKINSEEYSKTEFPFDVVLFQAFAKGDKMETIIQKATELGATEIYPVYTDRCVSRPDKKSMDSKLIRYNKIAENASSQSGRGIIPKIHPPINYIDAINILKKLDIGFVCYEGDETITIKEALNKSNVSAVGFLIGPEGGISTNECTLSQVNDVPLVGLGKRILRTETASSYVLSVLSVIFSWNFLKTIAIIM